MVNSSHKPTPTDDREAQFEHTLGACFVASPSEDFVSRITSAAFALEQTPAPSFIPWLKSYIAEMLQSYHLPAPVAASLMLLMLGISAGFGFTLTTDTSNNRNQSDISTIIYGEWELL